MKANLLAKENRYEEAEAILIKSIDEESTAQTKRQIKLRLELANVYLQHNKTREAYETYLEVTKLFPQNYFAWEQIYHMLNAGKDMERAAVIKRFLESKGITLEEEASR